MRWEDSMLLQGFHDQLEEDPNITYTPGIDELVELSLSLAMDKHNRDNRRKMVLYIDMPEEERLQYIMEFNDIPEAQRIINDVDEYINIRYIFTHNRDLVDKVIKERYDILPK